MPHRENSTINRCIHPGWPADSLSVSNAQVRGGGISLAADAQRFTFSCGFTQSTRHAQPIGFAQSTGYAIAIGFIGIIRATGFAAFRKQCGRRGIATLAGRR